ncbi:unnamed protein product, partial [Brassica rapa]
LCVLNRQPTWAKITRTVHGKGKCAESKDQRADMCTDGQPRTSSTNVMCVLTDTHGHHVCADGHPRTSCVLNRQPTWVKITRTVHGKGQRAESKDQRADMSTDGQPQTSSKDVLCVLTDSHRRPPTWAKITQTVHGKGQRADGQKSPKQSTGRASVLSPRTNVLICTPTDVLCVLTDTHGRPVHGRPMCADGHTRTSCVCWRTPTDFLCVLNRQPTWAKITQTVHGKGQRAESNDQRADMCTDGQQQTSKVPRGSKSPKQSTGKASVMSPRTNVLICVLMDSHRRPVCADGHTRTATDVLCVLTDTHRCPVCADGHTRTSCVQPTWAKIIRTFHGKGQRSESKDQRADMCADGQPQTSCVC